MSNLNSFGLKKTVVLAYLMDINDNAEKTMLELDRAEDRAFQKRANRRKYRRSGRGPYHVANDLKSAVKKAVDLACNFEELDYFEVQETMEEIREQCQAIRDRYYNDFLDREEDIEKVYDLIADEVKWCYNTYLTFGSLIDSYFTLCSELEMTFSALHANSESRKYYDSYETPERW